MGDAPCATRFGPPGASEPALPAASATWLWREVSESSGAPPLMRGPLGGYQASLMSRIWVATISCLALSCARQLPGPTLAALCVASEPPPATWLEVAVPASTARIRVPPTYKHDSGRWLGPGGNLLTMTSAPRPRRDPRHPEGIGFSLKPASCGMRFGTRLIRLTPWAEFPQEGGVWHGISATWEESEGTDIIITALAEDPKADGSSLGFSTRFR